MSFRIEALWGGHHGWGFGIFGVLNKSRTLTDKQASTFDSLELARDALRSVVLPAAPDRWRIVDTETGDMETSLPRTQARRTRKQVSVTFGPEADDKVREMSKRTGEPFSRILERLVLDAPMPRAR